MDMTLKKLFDYNHHSNQKLFEYIDHHNFDINDRIFILCHHIVNAQEIWLSRILGSKSMVDVWAVRADEPLVEMDKKCYTDSVRIFSESDTGKLVSYVTSEHQPFRNTVSDILLHVINHGTYHRAQINTLLRQAGLRPVITDYIFYVRENQ